MWEQEKSGIWATNDREKKKYVAKEHTTIRVIEKNWYLAHGIIKATHRNLR